MATHTFQVKHPLGALLLAFLGLVWCAYLAFPSGGSQSCVTSGCALFRDFTISGFSLWWVGVGYFFTLALLCLRGYLHTAWLLARLALVLDTILLVIMLFSAPCFDCLVVAVFFAFSLLCLRPDPSSWFTGKPVKLLVLPLWVGLFFSNGILAANELIPLWTIDQNQPGAVRIFFSPSCPHCKDALAVFGKSATLIPIAEKAEDAAAIITIAGLIKGGMSASEALERLDDPKVTFAPVSLLVQGLRWIQLTRNKAAVFKMGYSSLPVIIINGMPQIPSSTKASAGSTSFPAPAADMSSLLNGGEFGTCDQTVDATCQ